MLVAVVSDTHGVVEYMEKVRQQIKNADVLLHLGDNISDLEYLKVGFSGIIYGVKGNCDFGKGMPDDLLIELEGKKIFMTHGDKYRVKSNIQTLYYSALEKNADVALYGHTHIPFYIEVEGVSILNPGSPSLPRIKERTIAFIEIFKDRPIKINIQEIK